MTAARCVDSPSVLGVAGPPDEPAGVAGRPILTVVPDEVPDAELGVAELGSRIVGMAGRLAAATCRWLLLIAAFDARQGWSGSGMGSTGRWLSHYCGLSRRTASEQVRVARVLAGHPCLAAAMAGGRVSYSHVRAIARVADLGTGELVANLVMVAEHGTVHQLEDMVRGLRTVNDNLHADEVERAPETVGQRWREDSRWGLSAVLDPEHGALVHSAIETLARREDITHAQALTRIAEIALATLNSLTDTGQPAPSLRGEDHAAILIHLDTTALPLPASAATDPTGSAEPSRATDANGEGTGSAEPRPKPRPYARIACGPGLPDAVIQRLLCSGRIRTVITTAADGTPTRRPLPGVLDLGRSHRLVTDKQYRALLLRDGGCTHPGCTNTTSLEAHHVRHWLNGGPTDMNNLVLLCRRHHHAHHDGEFAIIPLGCEQFRFLSSDGTHLPEHMDPATLISTTTRIEDEHPHISATAATTRWDGTKLDRHYAVATLAQHFIAS